VRPVGGCSYSTEPDTGILVLDQCTTRAGATYPVESAHGTDPRAGAMTVMALPLQGKAILVTGGARRVGAAIVRRLHDAGANVAIHFRDSAVPARAFADELNARRADSVALVQVDLKQTQRLGGMIAEATRTWGRLDVLVNNASSFYPTPVGEIGEDAWEELVGTNLKAPLFLAQAAAPALRASGGCIVNIVDIHAERPMRGHVVYNVAKAGLAMLTRSLARELAPEVRVNGVAPGTILWPENDTWGDEGTRRRIIERIALKRMGEPDDIARAVEFFIADAPYVTGQILAVDGGRSLNI
jgi:pteridine reductase